MTCTEEYKEHIVYTFHMMKGYCVIFGSILSFQWFSFGSSDDYTSAFGNNFDGYTVIKDSQECRLPALWAGHIGLFFWLCGRLEFRARTVRTESLP